MDLNDYELGSIKKMLKAAQKDTDAASMTVLGENMANAEGCVLILKGRRETQWLYQTLVRQGRLTHSKPIVCK